MRWHHLSCSLVFGVTEHFLCIGSAAAAKIIQQLSSIQSSYSEDDNVLLNPPVLLIQVRWQG